MLIAEEFVLLALDADGTPARGFSNHEAAKVGVTGALVTELVQAGHLTLDDGRIGVTGTTPADPILAVALEETARFEGKKLKSKLGSIKRSGWTEVVDRMIDRGALGRERGVLSPTRHPVSDVAAHEALLAEVRAAAAGDGPLDPRIATLLALAGPCQLLEVVAPERSERRHAKRRIAEATEQVPAARAVKYVIEATQAAVASTAVIVAASSS